MRGGTVRKFVPKCRNSSDRRKRLSHFDAQGLALLWGRRFRPMPHTFPDHAILHLLWGGQSCPQPPFRRFFRAVRESSEAQAPAESRRQPGLAAPRFVQNGRQNQKVCGIGRKRRPHWGSRLATKPGEKSALQGWPQIRREGP